MLPLPGGVKRNAFNTKVTIRPVKPCPLTAYPAVAQFGPPDSPQGISVAVAVTVGVTVRVALAVAVKVTGVEDTADVAVAVAVAVVVGVLVNVAVGVYTRPGVALKAAPGVAPTKTKYCPSKVIPALPLVIAEPAPAARSAST